MRLVRSVATFYRTEAPSTNHRTLNAASNQGTAVPQPPSVMGAAPTSCCCRPFTTLDRTNARDATPVLPNRATGCRAAVVTPPVPVPGTPTPRINRPPAALNRTGRHAVAVSGRSRAHRPGILSSAARSAPGHAKLAVALEPKPWPGTLRCAATCAATPAVQPKAEKAISTSWTSGR